MTGGKCSVSDEMAALALALHKNPHDWFLIIVSQISISDYVHLVISILSIPEVPVDVLSRVSLTALISQQQEMQQIK